MICIECSTPIEGIHRCARCIEKLARNERRNPAEGKELGVGNLLILGVSVAGLTLYWLGLAALVG